MAVEEECASLSEDDGFSKVEQSVKDRSGEETKWTRDDAGAQTVRARVRELLAKPFCLQAEDGIRVLTVTGVQTCALPIFDDGRAVARAEVSGHALGVGELVGWLVEAERER